MMSPPPQTHASPTRRFPELISTAHEAGEADESPSPPLGPPATPTTVLSEALAASNLISSQTQTPDQLERRQSSPPDSSGKDAGENEDSSKVDGEEADGRDRGPDKRRRMEGGWTGKLSDQIPAFDNIALVREPVLKFERENKGLVEDVMHEFHLVLLEMNVWSTHRATSLKRRKEEEIMQGLDEIKAEEKRQEEARVRLLAFMNQISSAVDGINDMKTLST